MEGLTQFVTQSFEDKIRDKCFERRESHANDDRKDTVTGVVPGQIENLKCEEVATDLSMNSVEVHVDVCSSQPQSPQPERLVVDSGGRLGTEPGNKN